MDFLSRVNFQICIFVHNMCALSFYTSLRLGGGKGLGIAQLTKSRIMFSANKSGGRLEGMMLKNDIHNSII